MKRVMLVLLLITVIVSCGSDKATDPFIPIDPANLIGTWEGSYALTYNAGTDSARTLEGKAGIYFTDTYFTLGGTKKSACGTFGSGSYQVKGRVLEFEDRTGRPAICDWPPILHGRFRYRYNSPTLELHMTQSTGRLHWQVDVVKVPEITHH
jgi:hypothetical protein